MLGFDTWEEVQMYLGEVFFPGIGTSLSAVGEYGGQTCGLSEFDQAVLVLFWMRKGLQYELIAAIFGVRRQAITEIVRAWVPRFGDVGKSLFCTISGVIDAEYIKKFLPESVKRVSPDIAIIADGKESVVRAGRGTFLPNKTQTNNVSVPLPTGKHSFMMEQTYGSVNSSLLYSNKMHTTAARGLMFCDPFGRVVDATPLIVANVSEPDLWRRAGDNLCPELRSLEPQQILLYDKGVKFGSRALPMLNRVWTPGLSGVGISTHAYRFDSVPRT